ncbi:hypothetical protein BDW02DRAFT_416352 [Decorospora gaudefroyi]|uniref:F-box domain-containing protein n=1 Tax=Decorospora gaudefroyi TaxID=184978 RepID=A0A6A5K638_9PLEO|nr:hypothetical protein BDW02DRAFT_416352 [Decorospora gaudefroyi]
MPTLLSLPRELRDMIYTHLLTSPPAPAPTPKNPPLPTRPWYRAQVQAHASPASGPYCLFSPERHPRTNAASMLACNRQIHGEIMECVRRLRERKGGAGLALRLECVAKREAWVFTWKCVPLVCTTTVMTKKEKGKRMGMGMGLSVGWAIRSFLKGVLGWHGDGDASSSSYYQTPMMLTTTTTMIERLHIDIRTSSPSETDTDTDTDTSAPQPTFAASPTRLGWAICAALTQVLGYTHNIEDNNESNLRSTCTSIIEIGLLVLNVIPAPSTSTSTQTQTPAPPNPTLTLLTALLQTLWSTSSPPFHAHYCRPLLQRIRCVHICYDGAIHCVRELASELERGQAERRRIEGRMR